MLALAGPAAACSGDRALPSQSSQAEYEAATLCAINEVRAEHGLRAFKPNEQLAAAARGYAGEMVRTGRFAHRSASGASVVDRVDAAGGLSRWLRLGENLGVGTLQLASPQALVEGWMNSPSHRSNVLHTRFTHLGVGVEFGHPDGPASEAATYATTFGQAAKRKPRMRSLRKRA
jgi:uncharacterized protein YkwD